MENSREQLEALKDIRQMMKQSNRFLSLSGFSGIFAGLYALAGAFYANSILEKNGVVNGDYTYINTSYWQVMKQFIFTGAGVLLLSLVTALVFSKRKAERMGYKLFDHTAWRLMINMLIPLSAGGLFCIALLVNGFQMIGLISPAMLIFYGLALVNGSKYTLHDIRYLGCMEIVLGIIASFYMQYGLVLWAVGFGLLHIFYGAYMWFKYER